MNLASLLNLSRKDCWKHHDMRILMANMEEVYLNHLQIVKGTIMQNVNRPGKALKSILQMRAQSSKMKLWNFIAKK